MNNEPLRIHACVLAMNYSPDFLQPPYEFNFETARDRVIMLDLESDTPNPNHAGAVKNAYVSRWNRGEEFKIIADPILRHAHAFPDLIHPVVITAALRDRLTEGFTTERRLLDCLHDEIKALRDAQRDDFHLALEVPAELARSDDHDRDFDDDWQQTR